MPAEIAHYKFDFYIGYSVGDRQIASKVARDLAESGFSVFFDSWDINVGDSILEKLNLGLNNSAYWLVIVSEISLSSKWVRYVFTNAIKKDPTGANTRIIPLLVNCEQLPSDMNGILFFDISKDYVGSIRKLVNIAKHPVTNVASSSKAPNQIINVKELAKEVANELKKDPNFHSKGKRQPIPQNDNKNTNLVFVIMAFSSDMDPIFEGIKAAAEKNGLVAERVKDVQGDYKITDKIIEMICAAKIVVVDLTHERPNVYFELGYARGINKNIITVARAKTKLHFDIQDWKCEFYNDSRVVEKLLEKSFAYELNKKS